MSPGTSAGHASAAGASVSGVSIDAPPVNGPDQGDRILTIPNALSLLRLAGVPVFLWLVLGPHRDGIALLLLIASGLTDYLDGKLARMLNQSSKLGALLDPTADRLYIASTVIALTIRGIIPVWLLIVLVARDLVLLGFGPVLLRMGYGIALPVHFLGKAATFNLLYAFPLLLATTGHNWLSTVSRPFAWAFVIWGTALYWWAIGLYAIQVRQLRAADRADRKVTA
jgi:cardiolipin synthase (CMP-forming)